MSISKHRLKELLHKSALVTCSVRSATSRQPQMAETSFSVRAVACSTTTVTEIEYGTNFCVGIDFELVCRVTTCVLHVMYGGRVVTINSGLYSNSCRQPHSGLLRHILLFVCHIFVGLLALAFSLFLQYFRTCKLSY